jgi:hypothetical protein
MAAPLTDPQPWRTPADNAELRLLVHELVDALNRHNCDGCPQCDHAISLVVEWNTRRQLASIAAWLRAHQDALDWLNGVA